MPIIVQRHNIHLMMLKHNLYNRKTLKSYISSLLFGSFQTFRWLQTFLVNSQVRTQNLKFGTHIIMTMHLLFVHGYYNINSQVTTHPMLHALDSEKEKYLVANTKIGIFCTNLNCYILRNALQRL